MDLLPVQAIKNRLIYKYACRQTQFLHGNPNTGKTTGKKFTIILVITEALKEHGLLPLLQVLGGLVGV